MARKVTVPGARVLSFYLATRHIGVLDRFGAVCGAKSRCDALRLLLEALDESSTPGDSRCQRTLVESR